MFCVFNKQKICAYLIASSTVVVLFIVSIFFTGNNIETMQMSGEAGKLVPIYQVETNKKRISLSINCAWSADDMDKIIETLDKCNVKATFFMVGEWVDKYPEYVKKLSDKGHEIANHSNTHAHVNDLNYDDNVKEIQKCTEKIEKITGKKTLLYRCPYGEYNDTVIKAAMDNNYKVVQWSIDTLDYQGLDESQMWDRINKNLQNGSIILMHSGTDNTANSLEGIIKNIQNKGYNIVKISELVYTENYEIDANGVQKSNV